MITHCRLQKGSHFSCLQAFKEHSKRSMIRNEKIMGQMQESYEDSSEALV